MADLLVCGECDGIEGVHRAWCRYFQPAGVDPRDAEIARLKAEVARHRASVSLLSERAAALIADLAAHKRALAAGPAALRAMMAQDNHGDTFDACAEIVEAAQEAAMKEKP